MDLIGLTFRNAIGRFMRIYKRESLDEERPLHQSKQETAKAAIEGLLKLTDLYSGIEAQSKIAADAKDRYSTFKKAQKYRYIPFVTKQTEFNKNQNRINELANQIEELARKSSGGLLDLDSMQAEQLSILKGNTFTSLSINSVDAYVSCAFVNHKYLILVYSSIAVY